MLPSETGSLNSIKDAAEAERAVDEVWR